MALPVRERVVRAPWRIGENLVFLYEDPPT
jgi:hypothetical protein